MERDVPVSLVTTHRIHRNSRKLHQGRFRMDSRKNFITLRVVKNWNRFPSKMVDAHDVADSGQEAFG